MTDAVIEGITNRYIELYEHITGEPFQPAESEDIEKRIEQNIKQCLERL